MKTITLLISSAGRRVELIRCFRESARNLGYDARIVAVDMVPELSAGCAEADSAFRVPRCTDPGFGRHVLELAVKTGGTLVIPTIDTELQAYSSDLALFRERDVHVSVSDLPVVQLARNKQSTFDWLAAHGIPASRTVSLSQLLTSPESLRFPVILKPLDGSSSTGIRVVPSVGQLAGVENPADYIAQEYWIGKEYTVNMYFDFSGRFHVAVPHLRQEVRAGEVSKGRTERHEGLLGIAEKIGRNLEGARGALCFQAIIREDGAIAVFEINARFGGGYPLTHAAGAPFTQWILEERLGCEPSITDKWKSGVQMLRHDESFFPGR